MTELRRSHSIVWFYPNKLMKIDHDNLRMKYSALNVEEERRDGKANTPFIRWSWLDELALRAHDERSSCALWAHVVCS